MRIPRHIYGLAPRRINFVSGRGVICFLKEYRYEILQPLWLFDTEVYSGVVDISLWVCLGIYVLGAAHGRRGGDGIR